MYVGDISKTIQGSSVKFYTTLSVYCIVYLQPKVKSPFVIIYLTPSILLLPPLVTPILLSMSTSFYWFICLLCLLVTRVFFLALLLS